MKINKNPLGVFSIIILLSGCIHEEPQIKTISNPLKNGMTTSINVDRFFDSSYIRILEAALGEDLYVFAETRDFEDFKEAQEDVNLCWFNEYKYALDNQTSNLSTYNTLISEIHDYYEDGNVAMALLSLNSLYTAAGCISSLSNHLSEFSITVNIPFAELNVSCSRYFDAKDDLLNSYPTLGNLEENLVRDIIVYAKLIKNRYSTLKQIPNNDCGSIYQAKSEILRDQAITCIAAGAALGIFVNPFAGVATMIVCTNNYNAGLRMAHLEYTNCLNN